MNQSIPVCTPEQIKILQNQQFTDTQPGTLLKDFNTLLDFIGDSGVAVTEKCQLLAMNKLADLNQRLSHPFDVKLKRPQQKAYPNINGLYLLLRCSGLSCFDGDGKKTKLVLDKNRLAKWLNLNSTEQYFFLLQSFFYHATSEIIADYLELDRESCFFRCLDFYQKHLKEDCLDTKNRHSYTDFLYYVPGLHNLALMEFFGFVTVECDAGNERETWPIAKVKATDLGHAILGYFAQHRLILLGVMFGYGEGVSNSWEDEFKKVIPTWQNSILPDNNLAIAAQQEGCYVFKVKLEKASCTLGVPSNLSLDELVQGILDAFNFDNDHLYEFIYKNQYGIEEHISHPYLDEYREGDFTTDECSVGSLPLYKGMTITFLFDFGDNWKFKIQVAQMPSPELQFDDLTVIEKKGTPPEQYPDYDEDDE